MKTEEVKFYSRRQRLGAVLYTPDGTFGEAGFPGIVLCTGFTGTTSNSAFFATPFVEAGYSVLAIDYRGWGLSEGSDVDGEIYPLDQVEDIYSGLSFMETRAEVDSGRLALVGVSFGGGNVVYAGAHDERARVVISVSGVGHGERWLRRMRTEWGWQDYQATLAENRKSSVLTGSGESVDPTELIMIASPERRVRKGEGSKLSTPLACADAVIRYRPALLSGLISPRALLVIGVDGDPVVPIEHSQLMYDNAKSPRRLVTVKGDTHYEAYETFQDVIFGESLRWLETHLKSSTTRALEN